jgi:phage terminase large subunit
MSKSGKNGPVPDGVQLYNPQGNVPVDERRTAAFELLTCKAPEVVIKGPAGTGKSLALLHRVNLVLQKYPGARVLLVRKTRSSLTESALVTFEQRVVLRGSPAYPDVANTQRRLRSEYQYPNGSTLVVGGMDTPERVMSTEYDLIAVPEATELAEHDWELLITRLRNWKVPGYQQIVADMNPTAPTHWLNQRIRDGKAQLLLSRHEDNPTLWDGTGWTEQGAKYLAGLQRLSGVRYLRLFKGVDAAAEGVVYPDFDPAVHVIKPFDHPAFNGRKRIPESWRLLRSVDFGFRHPFVCQWWAVSPDGVMFRYREIYHTERIVQDHAQQINKLSGSEKYEVTLADHDAEDRATLHKAGIRTRAAFKSVRLGIDACTERLRDKRVFFFDDVEIDGVKWGRVERDPLLTEGGRPTSTVQEMDSYVYPEAKGGTAGKEDPVKENDDGADAWRYTTAYVDDLARRRFKVRGGRVRGALAGAR